ncbi:amino acid permease [Agrilactobacillus composti DSM 18527 = JCM 14202]|uniref:Amino acid permease n=1 Tax=Agrilactobacillus composti DSM 18527 = JCM 14202 TaxID=1423734 RepID=X0PEF2_9LACO|nr:APC family permease [Agrilactobacillus composti]KRM30818.1 amino acid permease [Agrilactobacillus composti DSM 18527 = JCM 14202]GAF39818.1 amino acid transporter [Agrilactobacillus composti DSM 18527 = JCM 14202]
MEKRKVHKIGLFQIVMLALGSLIGSGWLFGSWEASRIAGPAAIISWFIGAAVIGTIAYNYVELGTMFPESGGMSKFAQYTHGSMLGFIASWANWVSLITLIPIEAVAAVQYMSSWPWDWAKFTHALFAKGTISNWGLFVVFIFIVIFTLLNYWSVKLLTHFTSLISVFKIGVPLLTIVMLTVASFHPGNYGSNLHEFMPFGSAPIFAATSVSGIIFSFNAFQTVINMGNEVLRPQRNIGRGIAISLGISGILYILLQSTFVTALSPSMLQHGWAGINFNSPFADLAILLGIHWLSVLLYMDAFISPFGTGVSFVASTARALYAMGSNNHIPKIVTRIDQKYGTPRMAMIINALLSMVMVSVFRSWATLAAVISTATLIAYLTGPTTVMSLRVMAPDFKRPVMSKHMKFMAPLAFVLASLATYWAKWPTTIEVILVIFLGCPFYLYYEWRTGWKNTKKQLKGSAWMLSYLVFISIISFIGSHEFNGIGWLKYPWDFVVIIIGSLGYYYWGIHSHLYSSYFEQAKEINSHVHVPKD